MRGCPMAAEVSFSSVTGVFRAAPRPIRAGRRGFWYQQVLAENVASHPAHARSRPDPAAAIDAYGCDAEALAAAGQDEALLRTVVMMLGPELFFSPQEPSPAARGFDLDSLLQRIDANLGRRVTLADMEAWSDRTARAIQFTFRKRFGIGPMQWLRQRRLEAVRARLLAAEPGATIRQIAAACGIPRMATLIPEYTARFGERPSQTLARARR